MFVAGVRAHERAPDTSDCTTEHEHCFDEVDALHRRRTRSGESGVVDDVLPPRVGGCVVGGWRGRGARHTKRAVARQYDATAVKTAARVSASRIDAAPSASSNVATSNGNRRR